MNWRKDFLRPAAKFGGAALGGYLTGGFTGALAAGATSAATGGLDNNQGYNFMQSTALPTAVGAWAGNTGVGQSINDGIAGGWNGAAGGSYMDQLAGAGQGAWDGAVGNPTQGVAKMNLVQRMIASKMQGADGGSSIGELLGGQGIGGMAARGAIGGLMAKQLAPPMPTYHPTDKATLDAATIPDMQRRNAERMAMLNAKQSAQGGLSSVDAYQQALLQEQIGRELATQQVRNQINADNQYNSIASAQYAAQRQNAQDIISGALVGVNLGGQPQAPEPAAIPVQAAAPIFNPNALSIPTNSLDAYLASRGVSYAPNR